MICMQTIILPTLFLSLSLQAIPYSHEIMMLDTGLGLGLNFHLKLVVQLFKKNYFNNNIAIEILKKPIIFPQKLIVFQRMYLGI